MPLRFRSVVPYTLPGVLALIGWWWYISRKKERITSHTPPEGVPATMGLLSPQKEISNGLVEKDTPTNGKATTSTHRQAISDEPPRVKDLGSKEHKVIAQVHIADVNASPSLEQSSKEAVPHISKVTTYSEEIQPIASTLNPSRAEELPAFKVSENYPSDPERSSTPAELTDPKNYVKEPAHVSESIAKEIVLHCQPAQITQVKHASRRVVNLANAERPEPEGEVAQEVSILCVAQPIKDHPNHNIEEMASPVITAKSKRAATSEADFRAMPVSAQGSYHHILTSTPSPAPAPASTLATQIPAHDSTNLASEDSLVFQEQQENGASVEELKLLAAGLITDVIMAATQEVLGVTSCHDTDRSQPSFSSDVPVCNGRQVFQQDLITKAHQHRHLLGGPSPMDCAFTEEEFPDKEARGMPNGFSTAPAWEHTQVGHKENEVENENRGHWAPTSHKAVKGAPLPISVKLNTEESAMLAADSACSTCYSEDGISIEDLHNSVPENKTLFQVVDMSEREPTLPQPLAETSTDLAVLDLAAGNTLNAVCETKRLHGMGLNNGSHATNEVEADQSGGSDVNSMDSVDSGCTMGAADNDSSLATASSSEVIIWEIEVPKHLVGRLIGKQGRYVSFLKQNSGAKIYISTLPYTQEFQICHIEGTQQRVDKALALIGKKFKDLDLNNLYAAQPPALALPSLPMTSWLLLPSGVTVEVIVVNIVSAGHVFVQQHTHPTYHALRSLDQQMFLCYSQPGTPALPSPAEVGVICAAPTAEGAWWRAQIISFYKETNELEIRYVDYGGYDRVKIDSLRQIRSDFVTLPFQGAEVLLDNIAPLPGEDGFSAEATLALEEMTRGVASLAQVSNYDNNTGLPLVQLWNMVGDEVMSVNRALAERGLGMWVDSF
ncbi:A kinase (PRKA) anchor protein 1b isoform X1 [Lampris incognitus]|uniref:A kinase (PRKA) anchor protein 1b isoform X1 n=1 Tax=Lampris incognitus TaxID=2546036 RepID=UPI0024B4FF32|nr:A kinase (PRKA) anchor protein 1b isoform X1 [Lampris incognitus]